MMISISFQFSRIGAAEERSVGPPLKYEEPKLLTASIYKRESSPQKLLFRFQREATRTGERLRVVRDYTYPDGKSAAQETVIYQGNNLDSLTLRESQIGAEGSAKISEANAERTIHFEYRKGTGGPLKARNEAWRENTLIGDMIGPFLADHWDALMRGEKVKCRYIVVPRMETVGFTFAKEADPDPHDPKAIAIKMEPTSRIIAAIVDPLYFSMGKSPPHRILQYDGRTTPKLNVRGKWEDLDAVTIFDWK